MIFDIYVSWRMQKRKIHSLLSRLKINHVMKKRNMGLFLAQRTVRSRTHLLCTMPHTPNLSLSYSMQLIILPLQIRGNVHF
jgi:hypothetical protein